MASLRTRIEGHLQNWQQELPEDWKATFDGIEPDFAAIPDEVTIEDNSQIFPKGRQAPHPDAPAGAHFLRAFEDVRRNAVKVVVLGQDPYPQISAATGRAFEDGSWDGVPARLRNSLKRLFQSAILSAPQEMAIRADRADWPSVVAAIERDQLALPQNLEIYFNHLAGNGVIFVNASLTYSRDQDMKYHLAVWKPVLDIFLNSLAKDEAVPVVFLLLGQVAQRRFCEADPICKNSAVVANAHPADAKAYFQSSNPLERTTRALELLGAERVIDWWPPRSR